MTKPQKTSAPVSMEDNEVSATTFTDSSDICQQLFDRYGKSSATQHRHLCATAAATRSIIESESLPLAPFSYFAAAISTLADASRTLDSSALSALTSLLSIVLPLVPDKSMAPPKAEDAISMLVKLVKRRNEAVSTSSAKAVVKCIGVLLGFCDWEDWSSLKLGFETLLKFSIDKRPKVRRCAQECIVTVFKSIRASNVRKDASTLVLSLLKSYMPLAVEMSASGSMDVSEVEILSLPEHLEVIHMIVLLKTIAPFLSVKVSMKVLSQLNKLLSPHFSLLTRHVFSFIEAVFDSSKDEVVLFEADYIIKNLAPYLSLEGKNPSDSIICAAILLKSALDKLQTGDPSKWISNLPLVCGSTAGLLTSEDSTSSQASSILKELITSHISSVLTTIDKSVDIEAEYAVESGALRSICAIFDNLLSSPDESPNRNTLDVISTLFRQLGEISYIYMKSTILRLAEIMTVACRNKSDTKHLQECIGSAVIAIGPEKILKLLPINPDSEDLGCSNAWLISILSKYVTGSSLRFFMKHIVPLAETFQQAGVKGKKSAIRKDLLSYAGGCWGLLPAFCRHATDTYQNFGSLAALLVSLLKKKSFAVENIAIALQELVDPIKSALGSQDGDGEFATLPSANNKSSIELESKPRHSKKTATRNMKTLASNSEELLEALVNVFYSSPPEKRTYLKDAIGCLASISDSSVTKRIFTSLLERFQHGDDLTESGEQEESHIDDSTGQGQGNLACSKQVKERHLTVELASSFVQGASEDLIDTIYNLTKHTLQDNDKVGHKESYYTLARILEEHSWFCSSHIDELMAFLLGLKPPVDVTTLGSRLGCFQILLIHSIKKISDEENSNAFLVLNEIILAIKDPREEARKTAYDMLISMNSKLQGSVASSDDVYQKLISMVMGYLSSSSPQIKSGAVSALSILLFNNAEMVKSVPDLVPSVLALLQTKAVEVVKAVLGFIKVLVSSHQAKDLQNFLSDIINGVLSWSTVSRHHFRAKVTVILEIMIRKCGCAAVESVAPEKHMNFVKSVLENRRGKSSSKETDNADHDLEVPESSPRWQQKRKHEESSFRSGEDGKGHQSRFRMQEKRHKGFKTEVGHSRHNNNQSPGNMRNKGNFGRKPTTFRKNGEKQPNKKFGAANKKFGSGSKFQKQRNFGRKPK